jgi:hypothetical protein
MTTDTVNLPYMNNEFIPVHSFVALNHIKELTSSVTIAPDFMLNLYNKLINRHNTFCPTIFTHIPAPENSDITRQVIGSNGYYLKMTTTITGVDFIWHDREKKLFLFWGQNNYGVVRALNAIQRRIKLVTERYETDYSDMPPLISCE